MYAFPKATKCLKMQSPYFAIKYKSVDGEVNLSKPWLSPL